MPHKHTSSLPELEDVGLISPNQQTQFVRRIDILSLKQKRVAFISFLISSFIVVLVFLVGPPYLKTSSFVTFGDPKLTIQNFNINITNLNFFNRFLVLDVTFLKGNYSSKKIDFQIAKQIKLIKKESLQCMLTSGFVNSTLDFDSKIKRHDETRIFASSVVKFDRAECLIKINFTNIDTAPVKFIWSTVNTRHSEVTIFIKTLLCIICLLLLIQFVQLKVPISKSPVSIQSVLFLIVALMVASNPCTILDLFSDSFIFQGLDAFFSQFLFIFCCYIGFYHIYIGDKITDPIDPSSAVKVSIPFIAVLLVMFIQSSTTIFKLKNKQINDIGFKYIYLTITKYILLVLVAIFIPSIIAYSIIRRYEIKIDQNIHAIMAICFILISVITEVITPDDAALGANFAMQIYSLASAGVYVLFFAYFNWPVDSSIVTSIESMETNQDPIEEIIEIVNPEDEIN